MRKQCTALFTSTIAGTETRLVIKNKRGVNFRITSPLRGLKHCNLVHSISFYCFRITSPLRGLQNNVSLFLKSRYLCVNSALHYLRPPLRGLQNNVSLFLKSRYICVNSAPHYLHPPLRGLKQEFTTDMDVDT